MGISADAWADARKTMGEEQAAITVAAILQRVDHISSSGGYLRSLTARAKEGQFSVWPMVMALLRAKLDAAKGSTPMSAGSKEAILTGESDGDQAPRTGSSAVARGRLRENGAATAPKRW